MTVHPLSFLEHTMTNWQAAYNGLSRAGFSDQQIAEMAGCTRAVINGVRNGTYHHVHEPSYSGGKRVLDAITESLRQGWLEEDPLKEPA
jgi:hypothetical protein